MAEVEGQPQRDSGQQKKRLRGEVGRGGALVSGQSFAAPSGSERVQSLWSRGSVMGRRMFH